MLTKWEEEKLLMCLYRGFSPRSSEDSFGPFSDDNNDPVIIKHITQYLGKLKYKIDPDHIVPQDVHLYIKMRLKEEGIISESVLEDNQRWYYDTYYNERIMK